MRDVTYAVVRFGKRNLVKLGALCGPNFLFAMDSALNCLSMGNWMKSHGMYPRQIFKNRDELFRVVAAPIKNRRVLYLEFGVYEGDRTRLWSRLLENRDSNLHGFDSFEGLPENWNIFYKKGHFDTAGRIPEIADPRVKFFKGWFDETLRDYTPPEHEELFINLDADLYSSTRTVLRHLSPHITPGTYLYFDEFHHRYDEMKAFDEFVQETGYRLDFLAAVEAFSQVLFQRTH